MVGLSHPLLSGRQNWWGHFTDEIQEFPAVKVKIYKKRGTKGLVELDGGVNDIWAHSSEMLTHVGPIWRILCLKVASRCTFLIVIYTKLVLCSTFWQLQCQSLVNTFSSLWKIKMNEWTICLTEDGPILTNNFTSYPLPSKMFKRACPSCLYWLKCRLNLTFPLSNHGGL